jgi:hypothetical protein
VRPILSSNGLMQGRSADDRRTSMDGQRLQHACGLVDEGKYTEAHHEFIQLAENTFDSLERACPLISQFTSTKTQRNRT